MRIRPDKAFTLVEVMTVVAFIGILIAIAVPTFFRMRELSRQRACQENLAKIDGAKNQYAIESNIGPTITPSWEVLVGKSRYLRKSPVCPGGGMYTLNALSEEPVCSLSNNPGFKHILEAKPPGS